MIRALRLTLVALILTSGCLDGQPPTSRTDDSYEVGEAIQGLSDPAARRTRSEAIRDVAAGMGMTNAVLLAGIAQVETGLSHCWSEATWACQGPYSSSCGGAVIAGSADGPCSAQQGGLGMFQFDGGTYQQTLDRDGDEILLLEGNIAHAVEFVAARVQEEISGVNSYQAAIDWMNAVPVQAGNGDFEEWIALLACRYNGCCGCSTQEAKYRNATLDLFNEFEVGFWNDFGPPPVCEQIPASGAVLEEDDACAVAGGASQYWRVVSDAGHDGRLLWTHTTDSSSTENYGLWNLDFAEAGTYRLEVYTAGGYAESQQAAYRILHAGQEIEVIIDQSAVDGFQSLGDFEFEAGAGQWIRFDDNTGEPGSTETRLAFDALRVTPVIDDPGDPDDPSDPGDDPEDPEPPDDPDDPNGTSGVPTNGDGPNGNGSGAYPVIGGCQAGQSGSDSATFALLLLAGIGLSRRRSRR